MSSSLCVRSCSSLWIGLALLASCGAPPGMPDASPSRIPISPAGMFAIISRLDVRVPAAAAPILATLTAATDGPDDPARYLIDRMIATLPDGSVKAIAIRAAPYVAAYLNDRIVAIAPRFVAGVDAIATGLSRIATRLDLVETLRIDGSGRAVRMIMGARFDVGAALTTVEFAEDGVANIAVDVRVTLDGAGHVAIADHAHRLPYGALLRLGLDRAVVPGVEPAARDLAGALAALVDCDRLGAVVADRVGLGSATLYAAACRTGMTAIASEIEAQLTAIDDSALGLALAGAAEGIDLDGDGTMDQLRAGSWTGSLTSASSRDPIAAGSFAGSKAP